MLQTLAQYDYLRKDTNLLDMTAYNGKSKPTDDYSNFQGYPHTWSDNTLGMPKQYGNADSPTLHGVENTNGGIDGSSALFSVLPSSTRDGPLTLPSPQHMGDTSANSSVYFTSDHFSGSDNEQDDSSAPKRRRNPVPDSKKDDKYWQRRHKNNMAAKRSREMKKKKVEEELLRAQDAIAENTQLKQEVEVLKAEISSLRRLLKDANMTLSLWIKARQASEAPSKLPPMIRNPTNMPYVTFPVTTSNLP